MSLQPHRSQVVLESTDLPELCLPSSALPLGVSSPFSWCQHVSVRFVPAEMQSREKHPQWPVGDGSTEGKSEGNFCNAQPMRSPWRALHSHGHHSDGNHSAAFTLRVPLSPSSLLASLRGDGSQRPLPSSQGCAGCSEGLSGGTVHDFIRCTRRPSQSALPDNCNIISRTNGWILEQ